MNWVSACFECTTEKRWPELKGRLHEDLETWVRYSGREAHLTAKNDVQFVVTIENFQNGVGHLDVLLEEKSIKVKQGIKSYDGNLSGEKNESYTLRLDWDGVCRFHSISFDLHKAPGSRGLELWELSARILKPLLFESLSEE